MEQKEIIKGEMEMKTPLTYHEIFELVSRFAPIAQSWVADSWNRMPQGDTAKAISGELALAANFWDGRNQERADRLRLAAEQVKGYV